MDYEQIVSSLRSFESKDFDRCIPAQLYELIDDLMKLPNPNQIIPELFALMERLPDADLGSPGPIVHALERMNYVPELEASILRRPTLLTIWMVNRILNSQPSAERRTQLLELLASVENHPSVDETTRSEARDFIKLQSTR